MAAELQPLHEFILDAVKNLSVVDEVDGRVLQERAKQDENAVEQERWGLAPGQREPARTLSSLKQ